MALLGCSAACIALLDQQTMFTFPFCNQAERAGPPRQCKFGCAIADGTVCRTSHLTWMAGLDPAI